ncbi:MAG: DUF433 domain-containing protein [Deltaproteobacteria bacterium]|nr:DUF433 domain-containing protein [Deltaproteobacteria bacterium]
MELTLQAETPPLHLDASGAFRVGRSRVLLELVIRAFQNGAAPEVIAHHYPTACLADIYAVIAYYLRHQEEIEAYLQERERQALEVQARLEGQQPNLAELRSRLLKRKPST